MKRSILPALVAALALAVGFTPAASAADDLAASATAAQKAKAKAKKKSKAKAKCQTKGKARKSRVGAAAKKKAAKCKKAKAKPKAKPKSKPGPGGLTDGTYRDGSFTVQISRNVTKVTVTAAAPACAGSIPMMLEAPFTASAGGGRGGADQSVGGGVANVKWSIRIAADLGYVYEAEWKVDLPESQPCAGKQNGAGRLTR